jgi:hypothetical protein
MENSTERPRPGDPPQLDQSREILIELLAIERNRLATAVRIEAERKIVFPETTVIIRDILRLVGVIYGKAESDGQALETEQEIDSGYSSRYQ